MSRRLDEIMDYLNKNLKKNYSIEDLKWALIRQGYLKSEVEKAVEIMKEKGIKEEKPKQLETPKVEKIEIEEPIVEEKRGFFKRLFGN